MTIKQERINRVLNRHIDIDGETWTRRQWIDRQYGVYGRQVSLETQPKYIFNRRKSNSLTGAEYREYEAKMDETVPAYVLDGRYLTKIEYEYCQSLGTPPARTEEPVPSYQSLMENDAIAEIVHELQRLDDGHFRWWALAASLNALCSREQIDLIDSANNWNIND